MNRHSIIGVLSVILLIGSYALEYSLLEDTGKACPHHNCMFGLRARFEDRSCECDGLCNVFRDCCIERANLAPLVLRRTRKYPCLACGGNADNVGVYVVDTCPDNYRASDSIRSMCQQEGYDVVDPLVSAPVMDVSTGTTFKNRYCAECNGASPSSLKSWLIYLNCETLHLNGSHIWQNLMYNTSLRTWGVKLEDEFHKCEVTFGKPNYLTTVRFCRVNTIDSCPSSFPDESVSKLCESYSALVYDFITAYKNPHCAICNGKTASDLLCIEPRINLRTAFSFSLLVDVNRRDGDLVGKVQRCRTGEKYDPFSKMCRNLSCGIAGYKFVNGKCKKE